MKVKKEKNEELPTIPDDLMGLMNKGVVTEYPEEEVIFNQSPLSAVKKLKVNISSAETKDISILHKLHSNTRHHS